MQGAPQPIASTLLQTESFHKLTCLQVVLKRSHTACIFETTKGAPLICIDIYLMGTSSAALRGHRLTFQVICEGC